jgi:hypothetical protein
MYDPIAFVKNRLYIYLSTLRCYKLLFLINPSIFPEEP